MPYFLIQDFSRGLDARKSPATLPAGSLRYLNNAHITRGGEIEKRKAFVPHITLPPGSVGLAASDNYFVVYGNGPAPPGLIDQGVWWIDMGGEPDYLVDAARWSTGMLSLVRMMDGTRKFFYQNDPVNLALQPLAVETFRGKAYAVRDVDFYGSDLYDPVNWDPAANKGAFVTDVAMQSAGMYPLVAVGVFQGQLVLFGSNGIQVWEVDPDPAKNYLVRSLTNNGCISALSVLNFGNFDSVYLSASGIRSLEARQSVDLMSVSDIGTPVDDVVSQFVAGLTIDEVKRYCISIVEPQDARLWMSFGDVIMVHSFYKGSDVAAWSTYTPGFLVEGMATLFNRTYVRSGDTIYIYGGVDNETYDTAKAEVWTPFHHADKPATMKAFTGFDLGCTGEWNVKVATDPRRPDVSDHVGKVTDTTFAEPSETLNYYSTHMSLVLESEFEGPARLANAAMHYTEGEAT